MTERNELMNTRMMFMRAVAGSFLDRINRIERNGSCLNLVNPVNPV